MKFYDDDGTEITPDLVPKPSLCLLCIKDDDPKEEPLCLLNRFDQQVMSLLIMWFYRSVHRCRGGTRNDRSSSKVHTCSVNPSAIMGVWGSHFFGEPLPLVGRGGFNRLLRVSWGKQKL